MQVRETPEDYVEVYRTDDQAEALRIRDVLLRPAGIDAVIHDRMDHALLAPSSQPGGYFVAVPVADREQALTILARDTD